MVKEGLSHDPWNEPFPNSFSLVASYLGLLFILYLFLYLGGLFFYEWFIVAPLEGYPLGGIVNLLILFVGYLFLVISIVLVHMKKKMYTRFLLLAFLIVLAGALSSNEDISILIYLVQFVFSGILIFLLSLKVWEYFD